MTIKEMMRKAAQNSLKIRVVDIDGIAHEGIASTYTQASDEESGIASLTMHTDKGGWGLYENEIKSIEEIK